jgi:hypothetical protein
VEIFFVFVGVVPYPFHPVHALVGEGAIRQHQNRPGGMRCGWRLNAHRGQEGVDHGEAGIAAV